MTLSSLSNLLFVVSAIDIFIRKMSAAHLIVCISTGFAQISTKWMLDSLQPLCPLTLQVWLVPRARGTFCTFQLFLSRYQVAAGLNLVLPEATTYRIQPLQISFSPARIASGLPSAGRTCSD